MVRNRQSNKIRIWQNLIGLIIIFSIVIISIWVTTKYSLEEIVSIAVISTAAIACTWVVARYTHQGQINGLKIQLDFYEKNKDVNISELLKKIDKFVDSANLQLEFNELQQKYQKLEDQSLNLQEELTKFRTLYEVLSKTIKLEEEFILAENQSHYILNGKIYISILHLHGPVGFTVIYNGGHEELWKIGQQKIENLGNTKYRIIAVEKFSFPVYKKDCIKFRVEKLPNNIDN